MAVPPHAEDSLRARRRPAALDDVPQGPNFSGQFPLEPLPYAAVARSRAHEGRSWRGCSFSDRTSAGTRSTTLARWAPARFLVSARSTPTPLRAAQDINSTGSATTTFAPRFNMWFTLAFEATQARAAGDARRLHELPRRVDPPLAALKLFKIRWTRGRALRRSLSTEGVARSRRARGVPYAISTSRSSARRRATCRSREPYAGRRRARLTRTPCSRGMAWHEGSRILRRVPRSVSPPPALQPNGWASGRPATRSPVRPADGLLSRLSHCTSARRTRTGPPISRWPRAIHEECDASSTAIPASSTSPERATLTRRPIQEDPSFIHGDFKDWIRAAA